MLKRLASFTLALIALSGTALAETTPTIVSPLSTHYIVTRLDMRKCIYPVCGGYFVKAVNQASTRCADGTLQKECHATLLDTKALRWSDEDRGEFDESWIRSQALVKGTLRSVKGPWENKADTLVISGAWVAQAKRQAPTGLFYGFKSSGIVCVTYPCPTIAETTLNYPLKQNIAGLDLTASGAQPDQVEAGLAALQGKGLIAAGKHRTITRPAGKGLEFVASEFYLPFSAKPTR